MWDSLFCSRKPGRLQIRGPHRCAGALDVGVLDFRASGLKSGSSGCTVLLFDFWCVVRA